MWSVFHRKARNHIHMIVLSAPLVRLEYLFMFFVYLSRCGCISEVASLCWSHGQTAVR